MSTKTTSMPTSLIPSAALPAWQKLASVLEGVTPPCATDPDAWFDSDLAPAIEACGWCPATAECEAFAVAAGERSGVWGGRAFPLAKAGKS